MRRRLFAHLEMSRPYSLFYVGLASLAGALLASQSLDPLRLVGAWAAPTLGWIAGLYGGDYFDRHLDAIAKPHRPIPSGRISPRLAFSIMVANITAGMILAVLLNWRNLIVALVTLVVGISYSKSLKSKGLAGNIARGWTMALAFLFGLLAAGGTPDLLLVPLGLVFLFHDIGSNLVGTLRDIEGDRAGNYATFPVQHGVKATVAVIALVFLFSQVIAVGYPLAVGMALNYPAAAAFFALAVALEILVVLLLVWAGESLAREQALRAHEVLVIERLLLAMALIAAASDARIALWVGVPSLVLTALAQVFLRRRYEFEQPRSPEAVGAPAITGYIAQQLGRIARSPKRLRSIERWPRRIRIDIADQRLIIYLIVDGAIRQVEQAEYEASTLETIEIATTSATFRDIFLTRASNPRRAYLQRKIRMACTSRDMLSLNQLFNEFRSGDTRGITSAPPPAEAPAAANQEQELPAHIVISDTTLRDGEQLPGFAFSTAEKIALARRLDEMGVALIEAGFPAVSAQEAEAIREIVRLELRAIIQVIARPIERDIDAALAVGAQSVALFIGTSDIHLQKKLRKTRREVVDQVARAVAYAKQSGVQVVFAAEDATRTPLAFLIEVYQAAVGAGADALGLADTVGIMTPWRMTQLVRQVTQAVPVPLAVHCHNDLGLATANSIAGLLGGASGVQCSLLGIGERAGNAALEELVLALEVAYGYRTGIDLKRLLPASAELCDMLGWSLNPNKAVVGRHAFVHESGLHTDGIIHDPATYEPYAPELLGHQRRLVFGKHAGQHALRQVLDNHRVPIDETGCRALLDEIKRLGQLKMPLDEADVVQLARQYAANAPLMR